MKKIILLVSLLAISAGAYSMQSMFTKDGVLHFNYKAEELAPTEKAARAQLEKDLDALVAIPDDKRTFENTVLGYERAFERYGNALGMSGFLSYVSTDKNFRDAALALQMEMSQHMVDIATRRDVYRAIKAYADTNPQLEPDQARLLKDMMIGFKNSGMNLNDADLETFKKLNKEKAQYIIQFEKNIQEYKDYLDVTEEELQGLGEDYKAKLQKTEEGKYRVTLDYPDYVPFMLNSDSDEARKTLEFKYNRRGGEENVQLLEKTLTLRRQIAQLLGYKNHAQLKLENRMAKNPDRVFDFLQDLEKRLKPMSKKEDKNLIAYKNEKKGSKSRTLYPYESGYWGNKYKKENLDVDPEKIKEYFPSDVVINGMLDLFGNLFGISFEPVTIPVWHPDVKAFKIINKSDGALVAYFYMDLYPRDGKYKHAACFDLVEGQQKEDGSWQVPFVAIVANVNKPSADTPSLLKHSEVTTLFHEFGHVLHNALTKARYSAQAGTSVSWDFVEAPSQMLERWAWNPQVLKKISKHYKTGETLPDETIEKMIAAKNFGAGGAYLRQNFFAQYDMTLHTAPKTLDTTQTYIKMTKKIRGLPLTKNTYPQASFGHIMGGYDAGYYGYLWSEVIAEDFFSEFQKQGIFNPEIGLKYRREILEKGGTEDETDLVQNFLGRQAEIGPFLKAIGLEENK
ncbi:MAG: Zn-dependent oligopeptidase [Elusimicrobiaceae bacterium]|nr:Zn-dependent oligopeptidase [Elusimicrobiaceae bacterium]